MLKQVQHDASIMIPEARSVTINETLHYMAGLFNSNRFTAHPKERSFHSLFFLIALLTRGVLLAFELVL